MIASRNVEGSDQLGKIRGHWQNQVKLLAAVALLAHCKGSRVGPPLSETGGSVALDALGGGGGVPPLGTDVGGIGGQTGGDAGADSCESSYDCWVRSGYQDIALCRQGRCVVLTDTRYCPVLLPSAAPFEYVLNMAPQYAPIIVGVFSNIPRQEYAYSTPNIVNFNTALLEFNRAFPLVGLDGFEGGFRRPMVGLVCYSDEVAQGVRHLTEEVGVSAILSDLTPDKLLSAYQSTTTKVNPSYRGGPVLFMNTGSANSALTAADTQHLVWSMLGEPSNIAPTVAALLTQIEPYVNQQRAAAGDEPDASTNPLRVVLIISQETRTQELGRALVSANPQHPESQLWFNGKLATEQPSNFEQLAEPVSSNPTQQIAADVSTVLSEIRRNPPHVILAMTTDEFANQVIGEIERNWDTPWGITQPRPFYILSPFLSRSDALLAAVADASTLSVPLSMRLAGVGYALPQDETSTLLHSSYDTRTGGHAAQWALSNPEVEYDGAYYLLYSIAAAAANVSQPDGHAISTALASRVISDAPTEQVLLDPYGNPPLGTVITKFNNPLYAMSLWGILGPSNFDKNTGIRNSPSSVWCVDRMSGSTDTYEIKRDGLLYDAGLRTFVANAAGVPSCLRNYCPAYDPVTRACPSSY